MFGDAPLFVGDVSGGPLPALVDLLGLLPSATMLLGGGLIITMLSRSERFRSSPAKGAMTTAGGVILTLGVLRAIKLF